MRRNSDFQPPGAPLRSLRFSHRERSREAGAFPRACVYPGENVSIMAGAWLSIHCRLRKRRCRIPSPLIFIDFCGRCTFRRPPKTCIMPRIP